MNDTWWVQPDQLDDDQRAIVPLPVNGSIAVVGPPGSGKTNLLLLRANYLYLAGLRNVLVLVFTKTLQEFLVVGSGTYSFSTDKVKTHIKWQMEFLRENGAKVEVDEGLPFEERRTILNQMVWNLVEESKLCDIYDCIFIDEGQDYLPNELDLLMTLAKRVFIVADSRQKIYDGQDGLTEISKKLKTYELKYHYRNGRNICKFADEVARCSSAMKNLAPLSPTCNYREDRAPSTVLVYHEPSREEQMNKLLANLDSQLKAYPEEQISIVTPKVEDVSHVVNFLQSSQHSSLVSSQRGANGEGFDAASRIFVCTMHSCKGLEFRAVHFLFAEGIHKFGPTQKNLVYTVSTRTKTSFSVYYSGSVPGYFDGAIGAATPRPETPKLQDAFGRKS